MNSNQNIYDILLFHYPCQDGLSSAWVINYYHKMNDFNIKLYPIQHGTPIDITLLKNKKVLFCDYSPSLEILYQIEKVASKIVILDHHISAQKALENKPYAIFDMKKSGVGLAWYYFFPERAMPLFIQMIQDRDLWTWTIEKSREFTSGFQTVCSSFISNDFVELFTLFDELLNDSNNEKLDFYYNIGSILNRAKLLKCHDIANKHILKINKFRNFNVCIVNADSELASDLGNILATNELVDFAVIWNYNHPKEEYYISLRSCENKADVSLIAKEFGGGGHKCASGMSSKINPTILFNSY